jgi:hypothetical protein
MATTDRASINLMEQVKPLVQATLDHAAAKSGKRTFHEIAKEAVELFDNIETQEKRELAYDAYAMQVKLSAMSAGNDAKPLNKQRLALAVSVQRNKGRYTFLSEHGERTLAAGWSKMVDTSDFYKTGIVRLRDNLFPNATDGKEQTSQIFADVEKSKNHFNLLVKSRKQGEKGGKAVANRLSKMKEADARRTFLREQFSAIHAGFPETWKALVSIVTELEKTERDPAAVKEKQTA